MKNFLYFTAYFVIMHFVLLFIDTLLGQESSYDRNSITIVVVWFLIRVQEIIDILKGRA